MKVDAADQLIRAFESGQLSRRELAGRLMGLGAAVAGAQTALGNQNSDSDNATFEAKSLDHVALNVTNLSRSRDFYAEHLGMKQVGGDGERMIFMAPGEGGEFILALFAADSPGLNHYAYAISGYDPDRVVEKLKAAGLTPRREANRVYFDDPDGIEVQIT